MFKAKIKQSFFSTNVSYFLPLQRLHLIMWERYVVLRMSTNLTAFIKLRINLFKREKFCKAMLKNDFMSSIGRIIYFPLQLCLIRVHQNQSYLF